MKPVGWFTALVVSSFCLGLILLACQPETSREMAAAAPSSPLADNPSPPSSPVKLIFIHHSTGGNWLADPNLDQPYGGLGRALRDNDYYLSATNYGWGPDSIGDRTDIPNWPEWFTGVNSAAIMAALYTENGQNFGDYGSWPRLATDPGGENIIVMFKSCFPNSDLYGNPDDPPLPAPNEQYTVENAKAVYNEILTYFATRQDKLFIVITAPPMAEQSYLPDIQPASERAANARAFDNWLLNDWLDGYPYNNVAVFDYFNTLTSNGSVTRMDDLATNEEPNDSGWADGNHHRWQNGAIEHIQTIANNFSAYPTDSYWDSHPTTAGHQKATAEFVQLLNVFYNRWQSGGSTATPVTPSATSTSTPTRTATPTRTTTPSGTVTAPPPTTVTLALPLVLRNYTPPVGLDVTLTVNNPSATARVSEPVTSGAPIPRDLNITSLTNLRLLNGSGQPVAAQFIPLARWGGAPDDAGKPIRWLLLDFQADVPANGTATYRLMNNGGAAPTFPTLTVTDGVNEVTVNTGSAQFSISKTDGNLTAPGLSAPLFGQLQSAGTTYTTTGPATVTIALNGKMRLSVEVKGSYRNGGGTALLDYTSRYWFYAGQSLVRVFHTIENNNLCPLVEYGQLDCYDIGSGGSVSFTDLSLILPASLGSGLVYQVSGERTPVGGSLTANLSLYQDSSGTDDWDTYPTLTDWEGDPLDTRPRMQSYVSFRGYHATLGASTVDSGNYAEGWLTLTGSSGAWSVEIRDFWQNFPKALRASTDGHIEVGLFPAEFGPPDFAFTLRAGEHKTHEILLEYTPLPVGEGLGVREAPLFARAPSQWYVESGAFDLLALPNFSDWPDYENYVTYQLDTSPEYEDWFDWYPNLYAAIQGTDFYGIFDYGDWPIDYEGYEVSPLNDKYDYDYGMWQQWARGGDTRWFTLAEAADRHFADIDILHNLHSPRHWGDGIAFGHSYHDEAGFLNPHRNYGGVSLDTAFGEKGLLLYYYLTGYEKAWESAMELADCAEYRLHNDYNLCPYFEECSGEGWALGDSGGIFGNGERLAANALSISVAAYRATGDSRYLAVADALVQWANAADQPYINGPNGTDQSLKPWMLSLYLRALADYLQLRAEFGLPDTYGAETDYLAYSSFLRNYVWLDVPPINTGPRAAYPYEWWFDGRLNIPGDDNDNGDASINSWELLGADAMAYAYQISGDANYLGWAEILFRTGSRDPWFEGDPLTYSESKQTINGVAFGQIFLYQRLVPK